MNLVAQVKSKPKNIEASIIFIYNIYTDIYMHTKALNLKRQYISKAGNILPFVSIFDIPIKYSLI